MSQVRYLDPLTDLNARMLDDLTDEMTLAVVIYKGKIAHYVTEYGDGEGEEHCREFIQDCVQGGLVKEDELELMMCTVPLP